jgi:hypothetical protein
MTTKELAMAMDAYMDEYKNKPKAEQAAIAQDAFVRYGMLDNNGEFTDNYAYSRDYYKSKNGKTK